MALSLTTRVGPDARAPVDAPGLVVLRADGRFGPRASALDVQLGGQLSRACEHPRLQGAAGELIDLVAPAGLSARRVLVLDLGPGAALTALATMTAGAALARRLEAEAEPEAVLLFDPPPAAIGAAEIAARLVLGAELGAYRFSLKSGPATYGPLALTLLADQLDEAALERAAAVAQGVSLARNLVNSPASHLHPDNFGTHLAVLREAGIEITEIQGEELEALGMGGILAVGNGSARKPRVFTLVYKGEGASGRPLALVGKGMCFDAGGLCIKTGAQMFTMKGDMAGAGAVIGTMLALARQKAAVHVVGVLGVAENMLSGSSYKPGDIVTTLSGRTVEVFDTDCEGRMVLADILHYAATRFDPLAIVDLATLTYSVMRGLGHVFAGVFASHDQLAQSFLGAGDATGERLWRMPLDPAYTRVLQTPFADLRQHGRDLEDGDAPVAAAFLRHFVEGRPWVHLDIAGKELIAEDRPLARAGASGFGVQLLEEWIRRSYADLGTLA